MRRLGAAALTTCLVLLAAGCSDDPEPGLADPTSGATSVETSEVVTPTSPSTSPATPTPDPLGPEETVRAWVAAYNTLITAGEAAGMEEVSTRDCLQCKELVTNFEGLYADGGSVMTEGWTIERLKQRPDFSRTGQVAASINSARGVIRRTPTGPSESEERETFFVQWVVTHQHGRWLVDDLSFVS